MNNFEKFILVIQHLLNYFTCTTSVRAYNNHVYLTILQYKRRN